MINFPDSPSVNDVTTISGVQYIYTTKGWRSNYPVVATQGVTGSQGTQGVQGTLGAQGTNAYGGQFTTKIYASQGVAVNPAAIDVISATSYTVVADDNGRVKYTSNASAVTITIPSGMPAGFSLVIVQHGAGQITIAQGAGTTLVARGSAFKSAAQYAIISTLSVVADEHIVGGDTTT